MYIHIYIYIYIYIYKLKILKFIIRNNLFSLKTILFYYDHI